MESFDRKTIADNLKYLKLLGENFTSVPETSAEIINLNAILNLPKGTEHFISDIHGEFEAFNHVLRNCSGTIREKAIEAFQKNCQFEELRLSAEELNEFCALIYYPIAKIAQLHGKSKITEEWYRTTIRRLIVLTRVVSRKYSRSKIRKSLDPTFSYIIQELIFKTVIHGDRDDYYDEIINSIIETGAADHFIIRLAGTIRRLGIDHLHIVGDIYDRGQGPHHVMDALMDVHGLDIQWGNHDILWIGAAAGNLACIANVVRICLRYANTAILEDGYGINLLPLTMLALHEYQSDEDLAGFMPKITDEVPDIDERLMARMQKAISVIQFKIEDSLIRRNPEYGMDDRIIISTLSGDCHTVTVNGNRYALNTKTFPTARSDDASLLTPEEEKVIQSLRYSFTSSEKLQTHAELMLNKGSMYRVYNNNLIFHAGIPMNEDLTFKEVKIAGGKYKGKELLDAIDASVRRSFHDGEDDDKDIFWYLWCGPDSPLFGKDKMATFERYFIDDKTVHGEVTGPFYLNYEREDMMDIIFDEFGLSRDNAHIICGHIPVKFKDGESPIKAGGKLICIDAGFSKAYQSETGQAGCTLTYNSWGMNLVMHEPFSSRENAIEKGTDILSELRVVDHTTARRLVKHTDTGYAIKDDIHYLKMLLFAYLNGDLKPNKA
jgi:fructose-1,6-bisphosphatase-3